MKPLVSYVGAKSKIIKDIDKHLPDKIIRYYEPFVGGGSVLFHLGNTHPEIKEFHINDLDVSLCNLYKTVKNYCPWLIDALTYLENHKSKEDFLHIRNMYNKQSKEPNKSALYIYLLKLSFNSNLKHQDDGSIKPTYSYSHAKSRLFDPDNLNRICKFFKHVSISNKDYVKFLQDANLRKGDFVFLDPPYYVDCVHEFYKYLFDMKDYEKLLKVCDMMTRKGVKWMITVNVHKDIRKLFQHYNIKRVKRHSFISNGMNKDAELLICNY